MAMVRIKLNPGERPTKEQIEEIRTASKKPVTFSEDAPELTDEELREFVPVNPQVFIANYSKNPK